ncbi:ATP-binding protein [Rhodoferax sp.]|uniref:GAF domain-containing sensor histidine kinase n=1 Tax=Rhodoferax sp. TaxID=50421 RepID=UPI00284D9C07|nr:ATP-binding protein [Rhodoferax sp.]MDR3370497.1 ATP-binding protein [Rhodoferax sp.]
MRYVKTPVPASIRAAPKQQHPSGVVVSELTAELAGGRDVELLLEQFLLPIVAMVGAQAGAVRVLTDDGAHMRLVSQLGLPADMAESERLVETGCGVCGLAASSDMLVWMDDFGNCSHRNGPNYFGLQCQRVLAISLVHNGEILGIYNLFFESASPLSAQLETMLRLIGQLLGLSLYNARVERDRMRQTVIKERQEMVNEVHDVIAQTLAYVNMRLPLLNDAMLAHDDRKSIKYFTDVKDAVSEVHHNLREVMTYFRVQMDPMGLLCALEGIAEGFFDRTGIKLEIRNSAGKLGLNEKQEVQVFHVVQEALANTAKHSMGRHATVAIERTAHGLEFVVEDDGLGMVAPSVSTIVTTAKGMTVSTHFGLEIMKSRAQRLGGSVDVSTNEGGGTKVRLLLPVDASYAGSCP